MAVRQIIEFGDETLRKRAREVEKIDDRIATLVEDMKETMALANGVGLAAPQVGVLRRVVVVELEGVGVVELINPVIKKTSGHQEDIEGCLSYPGEYGITSRPMNVTVEALNLEGKKVKYSVSGLSARAVCHEVDHLDGKLFIDCVLRMLEPDELKGDKKE
ncbi:MAG: peptide deformylase [Clostridia bacterium]|nr:peptide deformylase [Clostridia bacterium]